MILLLKLKTCNKNMSIISVENLSKQYRIGTRLPYKTFRETLMNVITSPVRLFKNFRVDFFCVIIS